jgi:hypothetical protein
MDIEVKGRRTAKIRYRALADLRTRDLNTINIMIIELFCYYYYYSYCVFFALWARYARM